MQDIAHCLSSQKFRAPTARAGPAATRRSVRSLARWGHVDAVASRRMRSDVWEQYTTLYPWSGQAVARTLRRPHARAVRQNPSID